MIGGAVSQAMGRPQPSIKSLSWWFYGDGVAEGNIYHQGGYAKKWYGGARIQLYVRAQAAAYNWQTTGTLSDYVAPPRTGTPPTGWLNVDLPQSWSYHDGRGAGDDGLGASMEANAIVYPTNAQVWPLTPGVAPTIAVFMGGQMDIVHGYGNDSGGQPGPQNDPAYYLDTLADRIIMAAKVPHDLFRIPVVVLAFNPVANKMAAVNLQRGLLATAVQPYPWIIYVDPGLTTADLSGDNFNLSATGHKKVGDAIFDAVVAHYVPAALAA